MLHPLSLNCQYVLMQLRWVLIKTAEAGFDFWSNTGKIALTKPLWHCLLLSWRFLGIAFELFWAKSSSDYTKQTKTPDLGHFGPYHVERLCSEMTLYILSPKGREQVVKAQTPFRVCHTVRAAINREKICCNSGEIKVNEMHKKCKYLRFQKLHLIVFWFNPIWCRGVWGPLGPRRSHQQREDLLQRGNQSESTKNGKHGIPGF